MEYSTNTLAQGCFGKIYKEKYKDTWAAMKKVPLGFISREQLTRECKVYYNAHHNNVVKLLGDPWLQDQKWHIPLEFIFGEDLETTIFKVQKSKIKLDPKVKATIITGMCEGLFHLHSKDIVHQDLKPDNIMVEHNTHRAVIIDMGLAKFSVNGLSSAQNLGNEAYSAPEILKADGVRDKRSDVWAMGKIIAELIARVRLPTTSVSPVKMKETLKDNQYCNVVSKMVASDPTERASMVGVISEIRRAAILSGVDVRAQPVVGGGIANALLGAQGGDRGASALAPKPNQYWRSRSPNPPNAAMADKPAIQIRHTQPTQPPKPALDVVPLNKDTLAAQFADMAIPCPLPRDGKVVQRFYDGETGDLQIKEIITKNGKIVKYDDVKVTKS